MKVPGGGGSGFERGGPAVSDAGIGNKERMPNKTDGSGFAVRSVALAGLTGGDKACPLFLCLPLVIVIEH